MKEANGDKVPILGDPNIPAPILAVGNEQSDRVPAVVENGYPQLPDSETDIRVELPPNPPVTLYYRRFYILLLFSLCGFTQGCVWNTWGPLSQSAKIAFGWDDSTIVLMSNVGVIAYLLSAAFFSWLMDVKGWSMAPV